MSRLRLAAAIAALLLLIPMVTRGGTPVAEPRRPNATFDLPDSLNVKESEFGIVLGFPAVFNVEAGYWPDPIFGVRASGMTFGRRLTGLQGNLCFTVFRGRHTRGALAVVGGVIDTDTDGWKYAGLALDANAGPLFGELSVARGRGDLLSYAHKRLAVTFQLGLMGGGGILGPRLRPQRRLE